MVVPEEPGEDLPDEEIIVPQDVAPKMPGTGVESPISYYAVGSAAVIAGLFLSKKKRK